MCIRPYKKLFKHNKKTVQCFTWNINGLREKMKILHAKNALEKLNIPDIVCFQETHSDAKWLKEYKKVFNKYDIYVSHGESDAGGVATLIRKSLNFSVERVLAGAGRFIVIRGSLFGAQFTFSNVYAPADNEFYRREFYSDIISKDMGINHFIFGDFNSVSDEKNDRIPEGKQKHRNYAFLNFVRNTNSIDAWRALHPLPAKQHTFSTTRDGLQIASRLDTVLVSDHIIPSVLKCEIYNNSNISDHKIVGLEFKTDTEKNGTDFKKIKPHIFETELFVNAFEDLRKQIFKNFEKTLFEKVDQGLLDRQTVLDEIQKSPEYESDFLLDNLELDHIWWDNFKSDIRRIGLDIWESLTI